MSRASVFFLMWMMLSLLPHSAAAEPVQPPSPAEQRPPDKSDRTGPAYHPPDAPYRTSLDLLADYVGASLDAGSVINLPDLFRQPARNSPLSFQFVVVTAPGPEYGYDQHMEAVLRGATSLGYQLQSYWLPGDTEGSSSESSTIPSGPRTAPAASPRPPTASSLGVMLLRPSEHTVSPEGAPQTGQPKAPAGPEATGQPSPLALKHHLLIYVVPERPSSGILLPAFEQALSEITAIRCARPDTCTGKEPHRVAVLGPTFSASRASLARALADSAYSRQLHFDIVSGRASSSQNREILADLLKTSGVTHSFDSAMHGVQRQLQGMLDYLCKHDDELYIKNPSKSGQRDMPRIALLVESSTSWGQELQRKIAEDARCRPDIDEEKPASTPDGQKEGASGKDKKAGYPVRLLVLPYPVHIADIAQLGNAPTADKATEDRASAGTKRPAARDPGPRDMPGVRSASALRSEERALASLLRTIAQEQIWYVGVVSLAADDKYLLLRQVHDLMPGAQLFTLDADLRDTHPDNLPFTNGMLAASTYPIFAKTQLWQWPLLGHGQRIQFSRSRDIGVYNAFLFLMADLNPGEVGIKDRQISYGPSEIGTDPQRQTLPQKWLPSIWISRVTGEGVVPVQEYRQPGDPADKNEKTSPNGMRYFQRQTTGSGLADGSYLGVRRTGAFDIIIVISIFYFAINLLIYILHRFFSEFVLAHPEINLFGVFSLPLREPKESPKVPASESEKELRKLQSSRSSRFYRSAYFAIMAGFIALLQRHSLPLTFQTKLKDGYMSFLFEYGTEILSSLLFGFLVVTVLDAIFRGFQSDIRTGTQDEKKEAWQFLIGGWIVSILCFAICVLARRNELTKDIQSLLYFERSTNLSYGLSILVPWLCVLALLIAWVAANRHRISLLVNIHEDFGNLADRGDPEDLPIIATTLGSGWGKSSNRYPIAVLLAGAIPYLYVFSGISAYEDYSDLLGLGFAICYCLIIREFMLFVNVAYHFDRSLLRMGTEPMLDAYRRLPVHFARNIGIQILESLDVRVEHQAIRLNLDLLKVHYKRIAAALRNTPNLSEEKLKGHFGDAAGALLNLARLPSASPGQPAPLVDGKSLAKRLFDLLESNPSTIEEMSSRKLSGAVADGVATVAEFVVAVNRERPLPSSVQPLAVETDAQRPKVNLESRPEVGTRALLTQSLPDSLHLWLRQAEDLVAVQRVMFINRVFSALRSQLAFVVTGMVLLLLAFNLFPFQPLRLMMTTLGALLMVILPVTLWIFVRLERDEVLSYIGHSPPGQLTWTGPFIGRLLAYIGVPLLSFLVAQVTWLRMLFAEVISPLLMGLR